MNRQARRMGVLGLVATLLGCAGGSGLAVYEKRGMSEAEVKRDRAACLRSSASDGEAFRLSGPTIDREAFARCMEAKGYNPRR